MKLADFVIDFFIAKNISHTYGVTGGAVVHLFDAIDRKKNIETIFCHHEQAAAFSAVAHARIKNDLGLCIVTTGPGGTNTITGLLGAWQDSIPCIFLSGQVRSNHLSAGKGIRQLGTQEFNITSMVKDITKYAVTISSPKDIKYELEKAVYLANEGRPGPVWVDLPLDFQMMDIDIDALLSFIPPEAKKPPQPSSNEEIQQVISLLKKAERPLLMVGYGVRLAHAEPELTTFIEQFKLPFVTSWTASDIIPTEHTSNIGIIGMAGQRGANLAIQNCDLLIAIGSHLCIPQTTTLFDAFAREAKVVMVNIDVNELNNSTVKVDLPICSDAKTFISELSSRGNISQQHYKWNSWLTACVQYKQYNFSNINTEGDIPYVNSYVVFDKLYQQLTSSDIVTVDGGGTALYAAFQSAKLKNKQRIICSSAISAMGSGLPESIGACFANSGKRTICIIGDGSFQLNVQELQTIVHHNLPIKIFVVNNAGYLAIRNTQTTFLNENYVGTDANGGLSLPDTLKIASAYGIKNIEINKYQGLDKQLEWVLATEGPVICDVIVSPTQEMSVSQGFKTNSDGTFTPQPLEDMSPALSADELNKNMFIKPYQL